jgi:hypothetical protein
MINELKRGEEALDAMASPGDKIRNSIALELILVPHSE